MSSDNFRRTALSASLSAALCAAALAFARPAAAADPSGLRYSSVEESQVVAVWNTNGNSADTLYNIQFSTGNFSTVYKDLTGAFNGVVVAGGFLSNTVYNARVRLAASASFSTVASSSTLSRQLDGFTLDSGSATLTAVWTPLPASPQEQSCEGYLLSVSTDPFFTAAVHSAQTADSAASAMSVAGLDNNTTYYCRLGTLNWSAQPDNTDTVSFATLTAPPSGFKLDAVYVSSAAVSWTAFPPAPPNATAQGYAVDASSTGFAAGTAVVAVSTNGYANNSLIAGELLGNTTWSLRLAALNRLGEPDYGAVELTTVTLSYPVDRNTVHISALAHELNFSWTPRPSAPDYFSCSGYQLYVSSTNFNGAGAMPGAFAAGAAAGSLSLQNLPANTTYYARLGTLNRYGRPNFISVGPVMTPPGPAPENPRPVSIATASIALAWSTTSCEGYVAEASASPYFDSVIYSSAAANPAAAQLVITGLAPDTVYYLRAGTVYNGATVYAPAVPAAAATLANPVSSPQIDAVWFSSAVFSWTAPAACSGYTVDLSTKADFSGILYSSVTANPLLTSLAPRTDASGLYPLLPNTSYYARIGSLNPDLAANFTLLGAPTVTMVNPVIAQPYTSVNENDLRVNWDVNSNPADTAYRVQLSTGENFSVLTVSTVTTGPALDAPGLVANTVYYARAFSYSRAGGQQGPVLFGAIETLPRPPIPAAYTTVGVSSVTANWDVNLNPAGTFYDVRISTSPDFEIRASSVTVSSAALIYGLNANTVYYGRAAGINGMGLYSSFVNLGQFLTNPAVPADLSPSSANFSDVRNDQITVNWDANTNSASTLYAVRISTAAGFSVQYSSAATGQTAATFGPLPEGVTWYASVNALGSGGVLSDWRLLGSTVTRVQTATAIPYGSAADIVLATSYGDIKLSVPAYAFVGAVRAGVSRLYNPPSAPCPALALTPTGVAVNISLTPSVAPVRQLTLTVPYRPSDIAGLDAARLVLAWYDPAGNIWAPLPSVSDTANNTVTGFLARTGIFQIMQTSPAASLADARIFPNPFSPSLGHQFVQFTNMPPRARVRIYTLAAGLVRELNADTGGVAVWDGTNSFGARAASGVYIVLLQTGDGSQKRVVKIAVER